LTVIRLYTITTTPSQLSQNNPSLSHVDIIVAEYA
jgi:hypothetical protein